MDRKTALYVAASVIAVGVTAYDLRKISKKAKAERAQIHEDLRLDLVALDRAGKIMKEKIESRRPYNVYEVANDFQREYDFQLIAVREEN